MAFTLSLPVHLMTDFGGPVCFLAFFGVQEVAGATSFSFRPLRALRPAPHLPRGLGRKSTPALLRHAVSPPDVLSRFLWCHRVQRWVVRNRFFIVIRGGVCRCSPI